MVKIGLSWPSLSKALGRKVDDPSRWAVLYLGSAKVSDLDTDAEIVAINRKGEVEPHQRAILSDIEGIVLLDGTWSQAKALWWRNAWMLKCQRVILGPKRPSRYGKLRKEPRGDGLSTIEAAGLLLAGLEKRPDIAETLNASFDRMLARYREVQAEMPELAPKPKKRDTGGASGANSGFRSNGTVDGSLARSNGQCCSITRSATAGSKTGTPRRRWLWIMMTSP